MSGRYTGLIAKYRERLPVSPDTPIVSLNEGGWIFKDAANTQPVVLRRNVAVFVEQPPSLNQFARLDQTCNLRGELFHLPVDTDSPEK